MGGLCACTHFVGVVCACACLSMCVFGDGGLRFVCVCVCVHMSAHMHACTYDCERQLEPELVRQVD